MSQFKEFFTDGIVPSLDSIYYMIRFPMTHKQGEKDRHIITPTSNIVNRVLPEEYNTRATNQDYIPIFKSMIMDRITKLGAAILDNIDSIRDQIRDEMEYIYGRKLKMIREKSNIFFRHLDTCRRLLADGPPHANQHGVDLVRAAKWVNNFKDPVQQRIAQKIVDNIYYISHNKLLGLLDKSIDKIATTIDFSKNILLSIGRDTTKSDYYISLLFALIWMDKGYRLDGVCDTLLIVDANIINIDDMMYTGTQTIATYEGWTREFDKYIVEKIYVRIAPELILESGQINVTTSFFRTYLVNMLNCTHYLVRPIISDDAILLYDYADIIPTTLISVGSVPNLRAILGDDYPLYSSLFHLPQKIVQATTVYFDHKVADLVSTALNVIGYGASDGKFIRFINNCSETVPDDDGLSGDFSASYDSSGAPVGPEVSEIRRCPYAWYKNINYDTGEYVPT
jgi:hypothetical protein